LKQQQQQRQQQQQYIVNVVEIFFPETFIVEDFFSTTKNIWHPFTSLKISFLFLSHGILTLSCAATTNRHPHTHIRQKYNKMK
jgi:hypothetical protein